MIKTYINYEQLKNRIGDDKELIYDFLEVLKSELENYEQNFETAFLNNDKEALLLAVHKFKSAIGIFGFSNIYDKLIFIENELKKNISINCFYNEKNHIFISVKKHIDELEKNIT